MIPLSLMMKAVARKKRKNEGRKERKKKERKKERKVPKVVERSMLPLPFHFLLIMRQ